MGRCTACKGGSHNWVAQQYRGSCTAGLGTGEGVGCVEAGAVTRGTQCSRAQALPGLSGNHSRTHRLNTCVMAMSSGRPAQGGAVESVAAAAF